MDITIDSPQISIYSRTTLLDMYRDRCRRGMHESNGRQYASLRLREPITLKMKDTDPVLTDEYIELQCIYCGVRYEEKT